MIDILYNVKNKSLSLGIDLVEKERPRFEKDDLVVHTVEGVLGNIVDIDYKLYSTETFKGKKMGDERRRVARLSGVTINNELLYNIKRYTPVYILSDGRRVDSWTSLVKVNTILK